MTRTTICEVCGDTVRDVGLIMPSNLDGSVHGGCITWRITNVNTGHSWLSTPADRRR